MHDCELLIPPLGRGEGLFHLSMLQLIQKGNLAEWLTIIAIILVAMPFELWVEPRHRLFRLDNTAIQFPMTAREHVPNWLLVLLAFLIPLALLSLLCFGSQRFRKVGEQTLLAFMFAMSLNMLVTNGLKFMIGNPRPDFLSRCMPKAGTAIDKFVDASVCTNKNVAVMQEAFKSSPSGHSSNAFCGLGFLTLWLNGQAKAFGAITTSYSACAYLSPFMLALFIAVSRIIDYRHHWYDVLCGSLLGFSIAYGSYNLYFNRRWPSSPSYSPSPTRDSLPV